MVGPATGGMPTDPRALHELSRAAFQRGDLAKAFSLADKLLEQTQHAPQACAWAAWIRLEAGQWQRAIELARIGIGRGRSGALLGILGQAHEAGGQLAPAEAAYREALQEQPGYAPWMLHLAGALLRTDREFEAMEQFRLGTSIEPNPSCLFLLAHLELTFGDPAAAMRAVEQALLLGKPDPTDHTVAAKVLMELGRDQEAEGHWRQAGETEDVELNRIRFLREHGRFQEAVACLESLVEKHPESATSHALLAKSRPVTDLAEVEKLERLARRKGVPPADRMGLEFAIGKAYDDLGRYEDAMTLFDRANAFGFQQIAARGGFDSAQYADEIQARKETYHPEAIRAAHSAGFPTELPIFVVGMLRSGTTLVEQILARHPSVSGAGEQKNWIAAEGKFADYKAHRLRHESLRETAATYVRLLDRFRGEAERVVDKQPGNLLLCGALHAAFSNARIVYMYREPLDNAVSIWSTNIQTPLPFMHDKRNLAFAIRQHEGLMRHWQEVLPGDRFMALSYEALVTDQEAKTRELLAFCGLPWDEACLSPEKGTGRVVTPSLWQVRQPVYRTSIGRWKNYEPWLGEFGSLA